MFTHAIAMGCPTDPTILGSKGAGLAQLTELGLPVPPAFVIGTPAGRAYLADGTLPAGLMDEVETQLRTLQARTGRQFGDAADPLLVSVRSGAPVSMPGMMDTVLNVGLTEAGAHGLAARTGDARFAWTSFERLLDGFARTVRGIGAGRVEDALLDVAPLPDPAAAARARCTALLQLIAGRGGAFPDARGQLREAIEAVFRSWMSPRAVAYRNDRGIDDTPGTAVTIQAMVFGNRDDRSASGVAFTRDPATGAPDVYGDVLFRAQGEDVVSGEYDTLPLSVLADRLPLVYSELLTTLSVLEEHSRDMCDVEFTIEAGRLYVLQTRIGQRSGRAAVRLAVDLFDEGIITAEEALCRVDDEQLEAARAPRFVSDPDPTDVLGRGLPACPGAVSGAAAFDNEQAQRLAAKGFRVILLRPSTAPTDLPGLLASVGVVTGRGGRTSHAAVVARGLNRAAVCGVGELSIAADGRSAKLMGHQIVAGELVSVDGDLGVISRGRRITAPAQSADPVLARYLSWRKDYVTAATG
ncbi:MAG TPA: pyruvate, phosphate dikinase [Sporichthyaceae bacterium]|nr:pyruvate, phosphate dikinase [Sporichthyaceae bacterium]